MKVYRGMKLNSATRNINVPFLCVKKRLWTRHQSPNLSHFWESELALRKEGRDVWCRGVWYPEALRRLQWKAALNNWQQTDGYTTEPGYYWTRWLLQGHFLRSPHRGTALSASSGGWRERKQRRLQMTRHRRRLTRVSPEKDVLVGDRSGWKLAGFSTAPIGTSSCCRIGGNGITNHKWLRLGKLGFGHNRICNIM